MKHIFSLYNKNLKRIHINRHTMNKNRKQGTQLPAVGVEFNKAGKKAKKYGHHIEILGPSSIIQNENKPLKCGAKCWIETHAYIRLITNEEK